MESASQKYDRKIRHGVGYRVSCPLDILNIGEWNSNESSMGGWVVEVGSGTFAKSE